jgi:hypothetical protein
VIDMQSSCVPNCPWEYVSDSASFPITTPVTIELTGAPELSAYSCELIPFETVTRTTATVPSLPPPGAQVTCSPDGTAYEYDACGAPASPCAPLPCTHGWGTRSPNSVPAGWPCSAAGTSGDVPDAGVDGGPGFDAGP